ncbi:MAG: flagellar basal body rod protein FlgB [Hyphomicrobiales bacterium]|nr:MAG: flagellar basal body rod protein FlgB [Hyphomicrobiales bacterium]
MAFGNIPVLNMLKMKMNWHQERQKVLAENVANANTPRFRPKDLEKMDTGAMGGSAPGGAAGGLTVTHANHLSASGSPAKFSTKKTAGWEITPSGNAVVLEEQMMKVTENQMDYEAATTLYARSLSILRTALGN